VETGTGKELIARCHPQAFAAVLAWFVSVNARLFQSVDRLELFGHEKGAFTGATGRRVGRFELAAAGTSFSTRLANYQANAGGSPTSAAGSEFERSAAINQSEPTAGCCATNRDLDGGHRSGHLPEGSVYRLNVFPIEIPALRERREESRCWLSTTLAFRAESWKPHPRNQQKKRWV